MSHYLFQSLWPTLAFWAVLYISDYVLTVTCARLYRGGIDRNIVFEGSFELNPVFQKDIDSLRWLSPRFIWLLFLTEVYEPPPNPTGARHGGHVLAGALEARRASALCTGAPDA